MNKGIEKHNKSPPKKQKTKKNESARRKTENERYVPRVQLLLLLLWPGGEYRCGLWRRRRRRRRSERRRASRYVVVVVAAAVLWFGGCFGFFSVCGCVCVLCVCCVCVLCVCCVCGCVDNPVQRSTPRCTGKVFFLWWWFCAAQNTAQNQTDLCCYVVPRTNCTWNHTIYPLPPTPHKFSEKFRGSHFVTLFVQGIGFFICQVTSITSKYSIYKLKNFLKIEIKKYI